MTKKVKELSEPVYVEQIPVREEWPRVSKKRKVVQIISDEIGLIALCDDGNIYVNLRKNSTKNWEKLHEVPQD